MEGLARAELRDRWDKIVNQLKGEVVLTKPEMPDVTKTEAAGLGGAALLLTTGFDNADPNLVVICATVLGAVTLVCNLFLRRARHATEQHRIAATSEPTVFQMVGHVDDGGEAVD